MALKLQLLLHRWHRAAGSTPSRCFCGIVGCAGEVPADVLRVAEDYTAGANGKKQEKEQQQARKKQHQESK